MSLFTQGDLAESLRTAARKMAERLATWDADALLKAPEADVIDALVEEGTARCPRLLRDQAWMPPPTEITQRFSEFGEAVERRVTQFVLVVPFDGEKVVFLLRGNTFSFNPPQVEGLSDHEIRIAVNGSAGDAGGVRAQFDEQLDKIESSLASSCVQIEEHNARIRADVRGMVARRRAQLLATRNLQAEIGFPIGPLRRATGPVPLPAIGSARDCQLGASPTRPGRQACSATPAEPAATAAQDELAGLRNAHDQDEAEVRILDSVRAEKEAPASSAHNCLIGA